MEYNPNEIFGKKENRESDMSGEIRFSEPEENNNPKSKKKIIVIIALVVLIPIVVFSFIGVKVYLDLKNKREENKVFVQKQIDDQSIYSEDESNTIQASNYSDELKACFEKCSNFPLAAQKSCNNGCWKNEAKRKNDMSLCSNFSDNVKDRAFCQADVAVASKNPDNCDKIQSFSKNETDLKKYVCYKEIAIAKNDASICERIPNYGFYKDTYDGCKMKSIK